MEDYFSKTNTFTVTVQVRTKIQQLFLEYQENQKIQERKGVSKSTQRRCTGSSNFSCFNLINKENYLYKRIKGRINPIADRFPQGLYNCCIYSKYTLTIQYHSERQFFSQFTIRCLEDKRARNKNVLTLPSQLINNVS